MGLTLPFRRFIKGGFLRGMVIGHGQGHQLVKTHGICPVIIQQTRRNIRQLQAALNNQRRNGKIRRNVFNRPALGHQRGEGFKLVCRVHGFALHILGQADRHGIAIGHQQA